MNDQGRPSANAKVLLKSRSKRSYNLFLSVYPNLLLFLGHIYRIFKGQFIYLMYLICHYYYCYYYSFCVNIIWITHRLYVRTFTAMSCMRTGFKCATYPPIIIYKLHLTLYCFSCEIPNFYEWWLLEHVLQSSCSK